MPEKMVFVHERPSAEACVLEVKSIHDQYADASYSDFVEAPANSAIYTEYYHYSFFEALRAELECSAKSGECSAILDLACGNAILGRKLLAQILSPSAAAGVRVTAVDASEAMLKEARRLCAAEALESSFTFVHSNVGSLPVDLGLFDCVISGFFFGHANSKEQLCLFFANIAKHLKPGGSTRHIIPAPINEQSVPDGFVERALLPLTHTDGTTREIELFDYHWQAETYRSAVKDAGLVEFCYERAAISAKGCSEMGLSEDTLHVRVVLLSAKKPL